LAYWLLPSSVLQSDQTSSRALPEPSPLPGGPAFLLPVLALVRARTHHFRLLISRFQVRVLGGSRTRNCPARGADVSRAGGTAAPHSGSCPRPPQAQGPQDHRRHQERITHESQADERDPNCEDLYMLHYVPGGLFELILPIWLIVKGFYSSAIAFKPSNTDDGGWTGVRRPPLASKQGVGNGLR
jgi:hypothetical protein